MSVLTVPRLALETSLPGEPTSSLIRVADTSAEAGRWEGGTTIVGWPLVDVDVFDPCATTGRAADLDAPMGGFVDVNSFTARLAFECSTFSVRGGGVSDLSARVRAAFEAYEHVAVEAEFEQGLLYPSGSNLRSLTSLSGGPFGVAEAVGMLDAQYPGRAVLHMTPLLAAFAFAAGVLDRDNQNRAVTKAKGSLVAVGDGYTGLGPAAWRTATLTTAMTGANNDLTLTARVPGTGGNSVTFSIVDPPGNNVALSVGVAGNAITVTAATDGTSTITSTASQVLAALQASTAAMALISATLKSGDTGAGVVTALASTPLAGGVDANAADQEYAYVTGPVRIIREPSVRVGDPVDSVAWQTNTIDAYAERDYLVYADLSRARAALVDRTKLYT